MRKDKFDPTTRRKKEMLVLLVQKWVSKNRQTGNLYGRMWKLTIK